MRTELFQHLSSGSIADLRLFGAWQTQTFKQHLGKLLGRFDIELTACGKIDSGFQIRSQSVQMLSVRTNTVTVDLETDHLHIGKYGGQRHLQLSEYVHLFAFRELLTDRRIKRIYILYGRNFRPINLTKISEHQCFQFKF